MFGSKPDFSVAEGIAEARRIESMLQTNEQAWVDYKNSKDFKKFSLEIPEDALRYLIPSELLAALQDPSKIRLVKNNKTNDSWQSLNIIIEEVGENGNQKTFLLSCILSSNTSTENVLGVDDYSDNSEFLRQGIGMGFYSRLETVARDLGYKYITGKNGAQNINYFLDKLGRKRVDSAPQSVKEDLGYGGTKDINRYLTYKEL